MDESVGAVINWLMSFDATTIYALGFGVLLLCGFGLPVPEDITLLLMGYMTYRALPDGTPRPGADVVVATCVGLAGVMIGDGCMFTLGRRLGVRLLGRWPFRSMFGRGRLEQAQGFLTRNGAKVLFSARFMPGLRSVVFFTSGTLGISFGRFLIYDGAAALLSVPALVFSSWYWGAQFDEVVAKARAAEHGILAVILLLAAFFGVRAWRAQRAKTREAASEAARPEAQPPA